MNTFKPHFYVTVYSHPDKDGDTAEEFLRCVTDYVANWKCKIYIVLFGGGFCPLTIATVADCEGDAFEMACELLDARAQAGEYDLGDLESAADDEEAQVLELHKLYFDPRRSDTLEDIKEYLGPLLFRVWYGAFAVTTNDSLAEYILSTTPDEAQYQALREAALTWAATLEAIAADKGNTQALVDAGKLYLVFGSNGAHVSSLYC